MGSMKSAISTLETLTPYRDVILTLRDVIRSTRDVRDVPGRGQQPRYIIRSFQGLFHGL